MPAVSLIWVLLILGFLGNDGADPCVLFCLGTARCAPSLDAWPTIHMMFVACFISVPQGAPHPQMGGQ